MLRHLMTGTGERAEGAGDTLPGADHTVRSLAVAGLRVGLSTGNARAVAMWKPARIGLDDVLRSWGPGDTVLRSRHRGRPEEAGADDVLTDLNQPDTVRVITAIAQGYALGGWWRRIVRSGPSLAWGREERGWHSCDA
ncbi:hypothetical protein ACFVS9_13005 [Streptomyces sp. NPDC058008]|uniref:hypothetical protein n=1 Tax=Streptomyces sp. NPDC058008 TaxID=3346303 RepID=UPI0036E89DD4